MPKSDPVADLRRALAKQGVQITEIRARIDHIGRAITDGFRGVVEDLDGPQPPRGPIIRGQ